MKKIFFVLMLASFVVSCGANNNNDNSSNTVINDNVSSSSNRTIASETLQIIKLPDPKEQFAKYNNDSLLFALENRRSSREASENALDIGDVSALLWAAGGINREDGRLTIPTSSNTQDMLIYMVDQSGVWLYNPKDNTIEQKSAEDVRQTLEPAVARSANATLYYVQNMDKASNERAGDRHAGSMYQNVGLYCAIAGLNNVVTGSFSKNENIAQTLLLPENHRVIIAQSIGNR